MDLHLNPDGPHSDKNTITVADGLAECVRVLAHATYPDRGVSRPETVYQVLGSVRTALDGVPQVLRQLGALLGDMADAGTLYDDRDPDDPDLAWLTATTVVRYIARSRIASAHREAGHLGMRDEPTGGAL